MLREYARKLRAGEITSRALTEAALARIAETEPSFRAFITVCADTALAAADAADRRIAAGDAPLLCGIPMALKDNICTAGILTTCASRMLDNFVPPYDAYAWERLREEGAVLLGKTNLALSGASSAQTATPPMTTPRSAPRFRPWALPAATPKP